MLVKISSTFIALLLFCVCAFADSMTEEEVKYPEDTGAIISGTLLKVGPLPSGGYLPVYVTWLKFSSGSPTYWYKWELTQTHVALTNNVWSQLATPRGVKTVTTTSPGGSTTTDFLQDFITFTQPTGTDASKWWGKFKLRLEIRLTNSGGAIQHSQEWEFNWTRLELDWAEAEFGGLGSGSGLTPEDLNDQNVNQDGFWASLFVPDESYIDMLTESVEQFAEWGPIGAFYYIRDAYDVERNSTVDDDYMIEIAFPLWESELAGNHQLPDVQVDLAPWETFILFGRMIMAGSIWLAFFWWLFRRAGKMMGA